MEDKCVPALLHGGTVTDTAMEDVYIGSTEQSFNGAAVTGDSRVTALDLAEGTKLNAPEGKKLTMTVNGMETLPAAGRYTGVIHLYIA